MINCHKLDIFYHSLIVYGKIIIRIGQQLTRKEGDSNPRNALGVYTLSRRASSTTRAPFLSKSFAKVVILF